MGSVVCVGRKGVGGGRGKGREHNCSSLIPGKIRAERRHGLRTGVARVTSIQLHEDRHGLGQKQRRGAQLLQRHNVEVCKIVKAQLQRNLVG